MDILPYHFYVCKIFGLWHENSNYSVLRTIWKCVVIFILVLFNLSQIIELITARNNIEETVEVLFTTCTYFLCLMKILNFVLRYDELGDLLDDFRKPLCQPVTKDECEIVQNYNSQITKVYFSYSMLSHFAGIAMLSKALISYYKSEFNLPFKVYQPYDISIDRYYWISYSIQLYAIVVGITLNTTMDTIGYSFIMLATCQYEIISSRYSNYTISIKDCIEHHVFLQRIILKIEHFFIRIIVPLFFSSLITFCVSIFHISQVRYTLIIFHIYKIYFKNFK